MAQFDAEITGYLQSIAAKSTIAISKEGAYLIFRRGGQEIARVLAASTTQIADRSMSTR